MSNGRIHTFPGGLRPDEIILISPEEPTDEQIRDQWAIMRRVLLGGPTSLEERLYIVRLLDRDCEQRAYQPNVYRAYVVLREEERREDEAREHREAIRLACRPQRHSLGRRIAQFRAWLWRKFFIDPAGY